MRRLARLETLALIAVATCGCSTEGGPLGLPTRPEGALHALDMGGGGSSLDARWRKGGPVGLGQHAGAVLLPSGRVLAVGGTSSFFYDPTADSWQQQALSPPAHFIAPPLVRLGDGRVLVAGGDYGGLLGTTALYNEPSDTWTVPPSLLVPRSWHSATLLADGRVLIVGGAPDAGPVDKLSTEIYDPLTGTFTLGPQTLSMRQGHTATRLLDGRVLVVGGTYVPSDTTEIYDPAGGTWASAAQTTFEHSYHTAALLPDGSVLVVDSTASNPNFTTSERYDPGTNTWTPTSPMITPRWRSSTVSLADGTVLVAGGSAATSGTTSAEIYDGAADAWISAGSMPEQHRDAIATLLANGVVVVAGGETDNGPPVYSALYDPSIPIGGTGGGGGSTGGGGSAGEGGSTGEGGHAASGDGGSSPGGTGGESPGDDPPNAQLGARSKLGIGCSAQGGAAPSHAGWLALGLVAVVAAARQSGRGRASRGRRSPSTR